MPIASRKPLCFKKEQPRIVMPAIGRKGIDKPHPRREVGWLNVVSFGTGAKGNKTVAVDKEQELGILPKGFKKGVFQKEFAKQFARDPVVLLQFAPPVLAVWHIKKVDDVLLSNSLLSFGVCPRSCRK